MTDKLDKSKVSYGLTQPENLYSRESDEFGRL